MTAFIYPASRNRRRARGFTLIEAALVTAIVGIGCVAMLQLLATGTVCNADGTELTTAVHLANNIHELTYGLAFADPTTPTHWGPESNETSLAAYDDVDDFDGKTFSPPIDARRQTLSTLTDHWSQSVSVRSVDPNRITFAVTNGTTPVSRISITVSHNGKQVYQTSWLAVQPD